MTYVLTGHILTAQKVFTCLSLFNSIRVVMALFFPIAITLMNEGKVSIERIQVSALHVLYFGIGFKVTVNKIWSKFSICFLALY